jgi:translation initiation factor 1
MASDRSTGSRLVYSTDQGRLCPGCSAPVGECRCRDKRCVTPLAAGGVVRVSRETKGRAGKGVTLVAGLALDEAALTRLARELKARCATGGTVREGLIELQGEHRDTLVQELTRRGYVVRRAGG